MGLLDEIGSAIAGLFKGSGEPLIPPGEDPPGGPLSFGPFGFGGGTPRDKRQEEVPDDKKALDLGFALQLEGASERLTQSIENIGTDPDEFQLALLGMDQALAASSERGNIFARIDIGTEISEILSGDDAEISAADLQRLTELTGEAEALLAPPDETEELTPEDEAFQGLLRRGTELDVLLKEQQLAASQRQQEFAGITSMLDMLPNKQRVAVMTALLESPIGAELFFGAQPTTSGPAGGGAVGPTIFGEAGTERFQEALKSGQFGGGQ